LGKYLKFLGWVFGVLLVLGLLLRLTMIDVWKVPQDPTLGASLAPTLADGDTVLLYTAGTPGFGDLVRCADPDEPSRWVIGRIVGEGGDTVEVVRNQVVVNGSRYSSKTACPEAEYYVTHPSSGERVLIECNTIEMGGDWHYMGTIANSQQSDEKEIVAPGYVYLLSDNREFHDDSREFGPVPKESCKETIFFRLWGPEGWSDSASRMTYLH
jgi:signal peptidase I